MEDNYKDIPIPVEMVGLIQPRIDAKHYKSTSEFVKESVRLRLEEIQKPEVAVES